ncbi:MULTISPECIES: YitT family protein [unclassified Fusibacter]|uniref:YczE/YyaS/YitT family protein n=1 Tax=unclassified Fusibacter TaxID=2624464 RepID=UPI001FAA38B1|nr:MULTISPECIES: hypothetical protein [unclassified Fusibacter]MCK8058968.1 hypothetical protein [Fusibacter sp. A2]
MKTLKLMPRMLLGLFLYALGIGITIKAHLGVSPWTVFHQGMSNVFPISLGQAVILTGLIIVVLNYLFKEKIGLGTLLNMSLIGVFIDWLFKLNLIPNSTTMVTGILMLVSGMFTIAIASWLYIGAGLGAGPRDGLMVILTKKTNKPVGLIRALIEFAALMLGILMGGKVGIGTAILVFGIGPIIQLTFKLVRFDVKKVEHRYLG